MIGDVEYVLNQGYPELHFKWDGVEAIVTLDQNHTILFEGYISLHPKEVWAERLPDLTLPANPAIGRGETILTGFTRDPAVVRLAQQFAAAARDGTLRPGPVDAQNLI